MGLAPINHMQLEYKWENLPKHLSRPTATADPLQLKVRQRATQPAAANGVSNRIHVALE